MSRPIFSSSTFDVIERAWLALSRNRALEDDAHLFYRHVSATSSLGVVRQRLLHLNRRLSQFDYGNFEHAVDERPSVDWLYYEEEQEVVPIYDEALALVLRKLIVPRSEIPHLLKFMGLPGGRTGVDVENHDGKGYHFHYGKVKSKSLRRFDVLLTFNKQDVGQDREPIPNIPLHIDSHASGKCTHIDAATIGHNRRRPIYLVCVEAMKSRGLANFLIPSSTSWQFYPIV